jgi:hypothetical protein
LVRNGQGLTIHSSRSRFAARLNSGVRPLGTDPLTMKTQLTTADRLHRSLAAAVFAFCIFVTAHKLGFRGKFRAWESSTTWADVLAALPSYAVLALFVGGIIYFWLGRRRG